MQIKEMLLFSESTEDKANKQRLYNPTYQRSYHWMRTIVGVLGLVLPVILVFGWKRLDGPDSPVQGSLSAYYHTGLRDFFAGILVVVGFLLITYKIAEKHPENFWSQLGGIAAIGVALVPTGIPASLAETARRTPVQEYIDSNLAIASSEELHYGFAVVFVVSLFFLCVGFAREEWEKRDPARNTRRYFIPPAAWGSIHGVMAFVMILAGFYVVTAPLLNLFEDHRILVGEWAVTWAFGLSWLLKGWNPHVLLDKSSTGEAAAEQASMDTPQMHTGGA